MFSRRSNIQRGLMFNRMDRTTKKRTILRTATITINMNKSCYFDTTKILFFKHVRIETREQMELVLQNIHTTDNHTRTQCLLKFNLRNTQHLECDRHRRENMNDERTINDGKQSNNKIIFI